MYLVQILLPVCDNKAKPFPLHYYQEVKAELAARFKGLTAYSRAPAEGLWKKGRSTEQEKIIVYEVMSQKRDFKWWRQYRRFLEKRFRQESVIVRAQKIQLL